MADFIDPNHFLPSAADGTAGTPADRSDAFYTKAIAGLNALVASEAISAAGALDPDNYLTELTVSGTKAYTLANGTYVGQRKAIECVSAASTPLGTVTIATMSGSRTDVAYVFSTAGARLELEWTSGGWRETLVRPAGRDVPAAASTLNPLIALHDIAIDGTDDWVLPSGTCPGQRQSFKVSAAANTPVGTISGLFYDEDGSADGVDINLDAAADMATVVWDGARWDPIQLVSATIS